MFLFKKTIQKKKKALFKHCIDSHYDGLYKHALWMTGNRDTAMDMVQETYFQAWQGIESLKDEKAALGWLITILRRAVYREQRFQYKQIETMTQLSQLDDELVQADSYQLLEIYDMLEVLSPAHRDVFLLHHLHGFSYEEIGEQLEVPIGTVMSRLSRAKKTLEKNRNFSDDNLVSLSTHNQKNRIQKKNSGGVE